MLLLAALSITACKSSDVVDSGVDSASDTAPPSLPLKGWIGYTSQDSSDATGIFLVKSDGSRIVPLASDGASYSCLTISPDGSQIAVFRSGALTVMKGDGTAARVLVPMSNNSDEFSRCPAWSLDGNKLAFITVIRPFKKAANSSLDIVDVATAALTEIAGGAGSNFLSFDWSPDGGRLLVSQETDFGLGGFDPLVRVFDTTGRVLTQVSGGNGAWSPDGSQFVFECATGLCIVNGDGTNSHTLVTPNPYATGPQWSPDGKKISYFCLGLCLINPDGTGKVTLFAGLAAQFRSWSPDSKKIAFGCEGTIKLRVTTSSDICVVNADGTGYARLMALPAVASGASWSPQ